MGLGVVGDYAHGDNGMVYLYQDAGDVEAALPHTGLTGGGAPVWVAGVQEQVQAPTASCADGRRNTQTPHPFQRQLSTVLGIPLR